MILQLVRLRFFSTQDSIYILGKCSVYKEHKIERTFLKAKNELDLEIKTRYKSDTNIRRPHLYKLLEKN